MSRVGEEAEAVVRTIIFQDVGQDCLEWDLNSDGRVIACRPFQEWAYKGAKVFDAKKLRPGHGVRFTHPTREGSFIMKSRVEKIVLP